MDRRTPSPLSSFLCEDSIYGLCEDCHHPSILCEDTHPRHQHLTGSSPIGWWCGCPTTCKRWGFLSSLWQEPDRLWCPRELGRSWTSTDIIWWWQRHSGALCVCLTICQGTSLTCLTRKCSGWSWTTSESNSDCEPPGVAVIRCISHEIIIFSHQLCFCLKIMSKNN